MAVQNIRQEFAHDIEGGGGCKRETGVLGDISGAFPAGRSVNAGNCTCANDAGYARNREGSPAIRMLRNNSAQSSVAGPRPETIFMRSEIPVVFVKDDGGAVSDRLATRILKI